MIMTNRNLLMRLKTCDIHQSATGFYTTKYQVYVA